MDVTHFAGRTESRGYVRRGEDAVTGGAVVAAMPGSLAGAEPSVCGVKGFMIDEVRTFPSNDGGEVAVRCAAVAALDIVDSPVHVHGETLETYTILAGRGRMVLGDRVEPVAEGSVVLIPPGVEHGLVSDDPHRPCRVLMTFTPGLAPLSEPAYRDERIVCDHASQRIKQMKG